MELPKVRAGWDLGSVLQGGRSNPVAVCEDGVCKERC